MFFGLQSHHNVTLFDLFLREIMQTESMGMGFCLINTPFAVNQKWGVFA